MRAGARLRQMGAAWVAVGVLGMGTAAQAQEAPVLVELYTSQGCVSCPPADAFFATLKDRPNVIALALHVDYWDYLGWEDALAQPAFTQRQKRYAKAANAKMIYTPQMIISGQERLEGGRQEEVLAAIQGQSAQAPAVDLRLQREEGQMSILAQSAQPLAKKALVHVVRYLPTQEVMIERGENAGQQITYHNIVVDWQSIAEWTGDAPFELQARLEVDELPVVVIIQEAGPGRVLAVAEAK